MKKIFLIPFLMIIGSWVFAQEHIAVFPFEDMENVLTRNQMVMFYREFSNEFTNRSEGRISVVPRLDVERLINIEAEFQLSDFSARAKTAEMGRVLNGTQILSGRIGKLDNKIRIVVSLYTYPELDQLPGGTSLSAANTNELFNKIPELVKSMYNEIVTVLSLPEGLEYEIVDSMTVTITGYKGNATTLNLPSHINGMPVTAIRKNAFYDSSLISITLPSSVTYIESFAFNGCKSLTSITVDNRNPAYASIDGVLFDKKMQTLIKYPQGRSQKTYGIPTSVTSIGGSAFANCGLTSITIPASVTSIGGSAFYDCRSLTSIMVDNGNPSYSSIDGVLFDKNIRTLISFPAGRNVRTYVIPSSVTTIGDNAFESCYYLTNVTIPSSVASIGNEAFAFCNLTSVIIPSSVMSIGKQAFMYCEDLKSITLSRRTQVGEGAFPRDAWIISRD